MFTQVKTPHEIFYAPQRLVVPLFQRPYVWSQEAQWELLWEDLSGIASRLYEGGGPSPHFLGAVVLQQQLTGTGATMQVRTVIDGQQRLTTLQLLLDAVHAEIERADLPHLALQVADLVENAKHFCQEPEDRYKVWPTNRDRSAFNEVMSAAVPVDHESLTYRSSRMVQAHSFFSLRAREWLADGQPDRRGTALVQAVTTHVQLVVIDLQPEEDAQEIFETLNARGTPLTAADLIKNFVFQRLETSPEATEKAYYEYWSEFETPFWEKVVSSGRVNYSRSSLFLNQWLISQTAKDVPAREVFSKFKRYVIESGEAVDELLPRIKRAADLYADFTKAAADRNGDLDRLGLFIYRTGTLESEVVKPLVLWLFDPDLPSIEREQTDRALASLESWLVRRACVRAGTKNYNRFLVDLLQQLRDSDRRTAGDLIKARLANEQGVNTYWPGDEEVRQSLTTLPIYRRFKRARTRMILEAIEDHRRGWDSPKTFHEQRVVRDICSIEHVMPQAWETNWEPPPDDFDGPNRADIVDTLGNLTLTTQALNSHVSNKSWVGKTPELAAHTALSITAQVIDMGNEYWDDTLIARRTQHMIDDILSIWPVPTGHVGIATHTPPTDPSEQPVRILDLIQAGLLQSGQTLYPRSKGLEGQTCEVAADGFLIVSGQRFETPSGAADAVATSYTNGWWFWLTTEHGHEDLNALRGQLRKTWIELASEDQAPNDASDANPERH